MELFLAIDFSGEYKNRIHSVCSGLARLTDMPGGSFEAKEKLHITLSYIRDVDDVDEIVRAFREVSYPPFMLQPEGIGNFVNEESAVVWMGLASTEGKMTRLKALLDERLTALGYEVDEREYKPHITLAYLSEKELPALEELSDIPMDLPPFYVDEIQLFRAPLSIACLSFEKIATIKLAEPGVRNE